MNNVESSSSNAMLTNKEKTRRLVLIGMMAAVSAILMLFEVRIPFTPPFIKMDLSELPIILCAFICGPIAGILTSIVKVVLILLIKGTNTMFIGELANFIGSLFYLVPSVLIYRKIKEKRGALIGLFAGTLITSIVTVACNYFFVFPVYAKAFGMPLDSIIEMGSAVNPFVADYFTLMVFSLLPFNLVKYGVVSIIVFLVYKKVSKFIS